mgnify:CR=1 FL=1
MGTLENQAFEDRIYNDDDPPEPDDDDLLEPGEEPPLSPAWKWHKWKHPGETPAQWRKRMGHNPDDPATWDMDAPEADGIGRSQVNRCECRAVGRGTPAYPFSVLFCKTHKEVGGEAGGVHEVRPCGCCVVGNGTRFNPFAVQPCVVHL